MGDFKSFVYQKQEEFELGITARCVVHFRPKKDWKGIGYGFDWMRVGDTNDFGDMQPYKNIVSKQYENASPTASLVMNINKYSGNFRSNIALYNALKTEYHPIHRPIPFIGEYFCSWLSLFPATVKNKPLLPFKPSPQTDTPSGYTNTEADLRLYLEVQEAPDYLEFEENEHFEITPPKITDGLGKGNRFWKNGNTIKIKCKNEFNEDQRINVFAVKKNAASGKKEKKLAGRLYVWANGKFHRKEAKALLIRIKTPPISTGNELEGNITGQETYFDRYLSQALIKVNVKKDVVLDLTADSKFMAGTHPNYIRSNIIDSNKATIVGKSLIEHLDSQLQNQLVSEGKDRHLYDHWFKAYYFEEPGDSNGFWNAVTKNVVLFAGRNAQTPAHEFLHSFHVSHSFANDECKTSSPYFADLGTPYTYEAQTTENLMDYSHLSPVSKERYSLWHWQWEKANKNVR